MSETTTKTPAPIRALDKRLRDGRRFTLDLVPQNENGRGSKWSYWMQASVDGEVVFDRFYASPERNCSEVPGLPHVIVIQFTEPNPELAGSPPRYVRRPVGLTDAEADAIDAAKKEWTQRHVRAALAAAPDAPTWHLTNCPVPLSPGHTVWDYGRDEPVMVLRGTKRWVPEDGRSFGLDAEEGYLFSATVRALTPDERAEWDAEREHVRQVEGALDEAERLFGWDKLGDLPADAEQVTAHPDGDKVYLPTGGQCLVRAGDSIYADLFGGGLLFNATIRHPATAERVAVFETLLAASDRGHLHLSDLY